MNRGGFSLVELIVALTVLSIGLVALAGTAAVAQRSFATAEATEAAARAAAEVIDSLFHEAAPVAGSRPLHGTRVTWTVAERDGVTRIDTEVEVFDGAATHRVVFHAARLARPRPAGAPEP